MGSDGFVRTVSVRTSIGSEYKRDIRKLALLEAAGEMSAMLTSEKHLPNDAIPDPNFQGTQDTQGTQDMQDMQGTQGTQDELQTSTQLRSSKRLQEK
jgi:hypothetical protein